MDVDHEKPESGQGSSSSVTDGRALHADSCEVDRTRCSAVSVREVHDEVSPDISNVADPLQSSTEFYNLTVLQLYCRLESHGFHRLELESSPQELRALLVRHLSLGDCALSENQPACKVIVNRYLSGTCGEGKKEHLRYEYLKNAMKVFKY